MTNRSWQADLQRYLPSHIYEILRPVDPASPIEEVRLRAGQPLQLCFSGYERMICAPRGRSAVSAADCEETLLRMCEGSVYAWEEELRQGFLTLPGGYRVGISGRAVLHERTIGHICDVTGLNIRISRACTGIARPLLPALTAADGMPHSTLIVSPPGCGKTTLLRDLARACANGECGIRPCRVSIVDARYEIAGCVRGVAQHDVGMRTDVLSGCGKAEGMRLMLSVMSPDVLVADELSEAADLAAAAEAAGCGVRLFAGLHSASVRMLEKRASLGALLSAGLFERFVVLSRRSGAGTVEGVYDGTLRPVADRSVEGERPWRACLQ